MDGSVEKCAEFAAARRMTQLAQRLSLNLPDSFARDGKTLAHFFERVLTAVVQAEPHLDHFFFSRCQGLQHRFGLFFQVDVNHRLGRRDDSSVLNKVSEVGVFLFTNRRFQ